MPSEDPVSDRTLSAAAADGSESPRHSGGSGVGSGEQCLVGREPEERVQRRRHKRQRRERPVSSPGVYCDQDPHVHLSDPQTSQTGVTSSGIGSPQSPSHELQSQTHSNEESYYHRCAGEQSPDAKTCRACRQHSRKFRSPNADEPPHRAEQRRKRTGRSKDVPVDVSLDDNCPGVNLIRRRYTHRHVVCDNCLQSFGKDAVCGRQSRRPRHKQQSTVSLEAPCGNELKLSSHNNRQEVQGVGEGSGFITLYQLRTVAQILQESSGCVDDNVTQYEREQQKPTGPPKSQSFRHERRQHNQFRVNKSKRKSVVFDDCLSVAQSTELEHDEVGPSSPEQRLSHLKELAYPTKSRSGRDSPLLYSPQLIVVPPWKLLRKIRFTKKMFNLGVQANLSLSVLGGLVNVSGSAKYLNDRQSSSKQARVPLKYSFTSTVNNGAISDVQYPTCRRFQQRNSNQCS